jgi:signal transduction histidine kinase
VDLLEHAVQLVARERQETQRLRALAEVGRAASMNLRSAELLANALDAFADLTGAAVCAAGLAAGDRVVFASQHRLVSGSPAAEPVTVELAVFPAEWRVGKGLPVVGELDAALAPVGLPDQEALLAPMHHRDRLLGLLLVQPAPGTPIDERLITICRSVAAHLASALANARLYEELQKEHDDLLRSEIAREQLTQMVVHDLKNPLTGIRVNLDLLHMTELSSEQTDMVQDAQQASTIILQLISDMLDIARLDEGRLELRRTPTDLRALLEGCIGELDVWSGQENKQIRLHVDRTLPPLLVDHGLMRRVAINLLSNAIKHTPAGTPIAVLARLDGEHVHLDFHDDGPGIPAERLPYLFERWSTGGCASAQQTSSGLGLTFCRLAVEAHGGSITVRSDAATGTTFTVSLPLASIVEPALT